jgi:S1-C subfamily serine protease
MNARRLSTLLCLGMLAIVLVALPGTSHPKQAQAASSSVNHRQSGPDGVRAYDDEEGTLSQLEPADLVFVDGDDDVQVVAGSGQGWLGVGVSEVTGEKAKEFKLPAERGVVLCRVVPDSPAAKAGLKENDVVTEINGQRVEGTEQFRRMIREIPPGRSVQFAVWRDGRSQSVQLTLGKSEPRLNTPMVAPGAFAIHVPDMPQLNELMESGPWFAGRPRLGIDAEDLEGDFGNFFGAPDGEGVLVRGVFSDSPAAKAGVKVGDVISSVDGDRIHSVGELREKLVEKKSEKTVKLGLIRNKAPLSLSVELPPPVQKQERHNGVRTNI